MKFERQIDHSEKLAAVIPFYQNGDYYFRKGISAYKKQNMKKAVKFIEKAIKIEQDEPVFHCQLAAILAEIGEYERSNEILQYVLLEIDETMDECYFFMANNYAHLGLFEKAETAAKEYMKRRPSGEFYADSTDLLDLLDFERDDEDYEEEDELILEYDQAVSLLSDGNYDKAVVHLEQMTKQYPTYWAAYNLLAQALFKVNNYQQAINVCHQILQEDEGNLTARCNLAMIYYKTGNLDGANEIVQSLQVIIPIDVEQRYKIASTLCAVGKFHEAYQLLIYLQKKYYRQSVDFYRCLAVAAFHFGKKEKAQESWRRASELGDETAKLLLTKEQNHRLKAEDVLYD